MEPQNEHHTSTKWPREPLKDFFSTTIVSVIAGVLVFVVTAIAESTTTDIAIPWLHDVPSGVGIASLTILSISVGLTTVAYAVMVIRRQEDAQRRQMIKEIRETNSELYTTLQENLSRLTTGSSFSSRQIRVQESSASSAEHIQAHESQSYSSQEAQAQESQR